MEASIVATLLLAFGLGLRHATDADHISAVAALSSESPDAAQSLRIGALWGCGHMATVFLFGGLLIAMRVRLSAAFEWALELAVATVLVALGVRAIAKCFAGRYHFHWHRHGPHSHVHLHFHARGEPVEEHDAHARATTRLWRAARSRALLVGMIHGLAGTAGLALLALSTIPSRIVAAAYLVVFGLGALVGMVAFSAILVAPLARAQGHMRWLTALRLIAGTASGALGAVLTHRAFLPENWPF